MKRRLKLLVTVVALTTFTVGATNCYAFNLTDKYKEITNKVTSIADSVTSSQSNIEIPINITKTPKADLGSLRKNTGVDGLHISIGTETIQPSNPITKDVNSLVNYNNNVAKTDISNLSDTLFNYIYYNLLHHNYDEVDKLLQAVKVFNPIAYSFIDYSVTVIKKYMKDTQDDEELHFYTKDSLEKNESKLTSSIEKSLLDNVKKFNKLNMSVNFSQNLLVNVLQDKTVKASIQDYVLSCIRSTTKHNITDARTLSKDKIYPILKDYPIHMSEGNSSIFSVKKLPASTLSKTKQDDYKEILSVLLDYNKYSMLSNPTNLSQEDLKSCIESTMQYIFFTKLDNLVKITDTRNDIDSLKYCNRQLTICLNNDTKNAITLMIPPINKSGDTIYCSNSYLVTKYIPNASSLPLFNITYTIKYLDNNSKNVKNTTSRTVFYRNTSYDIQSTKNVDSIKYRLVSGLYKCFYHKDISPKVYFGDNDTINNQRKFKILSKDVKEKALNYSLDKKVVPFTATLSYTGLSVLLDMIGLSLALIFIYVSIRKIGKEE